MKYLLSALLSIFTAAHALPALAQEGGETLAKPWQLGFQPAATPMMERLNGLHDFLLILITLISLFVLALMIYIAVKFNRKANPVPNKVTHNTRLEIIWTVVPIIILVVIAIPSLRLHYFMEQDPNPELTLKVVGYQWYWHYDYPDQGGFGFDSYIKKDKDLAPGEHRMLAVDNHVVVPVDTNVQVLLTGADVIHAWAVPAFGIKRDAMPGRLNTTWFRATKTGTFYGQCSELCGVGHGFMPIVVDVVSKDDFAKWTAAKQKEAGITPAAAGSAQSQKQTAPITDAVSSEHKNPQPVIDKEKSLSKPTASDNRPKTEAKEKDASHVGNENQPVPAKAAEEVKEEQEENNE